MHFEVVPDPKAVVAAPNEAYWPEAVPVPCTTRQPLGLDSRAICF
jgi:hypothetical protein